MLKKTIEHILPQTITGSKYWKERFPNKKLHQKNVGRIGNLTLTYWNPNLSNKDFPQKKGKAKDIGTDAKTYISSPVIIEREISKYKNWTERSISKREKEMVDWALKRWCID